MRKKLPFRNFKCISALKRFVNVHFISCVFILSSIETFAQSQLLMDINKIEDPGNNEYSEMINVNGKLYFINRGTELWRSDGTVNGTKAIKKFKSGISSLTFSGTNLFFIANDGIAGSELWKSNGLPAGTIQVKDIRPGAIGSDPSSLTNVSGALFFTANDGTNGKELWRSDGTTQGTFLVKDIFPKGAGSNPGELTSGNGILFFSASDGAHGYEPWRSDGTVTGTFIVRDIASGTKVGSSPKNFVNVNGLLYFNAATSDAGRELWKTDGTLNGTMLVKDILPGPAFSDISNMVAVANTLFFTANDGVHGLELWKSNGTAAGTLLVKDMTPGAPGSNGEIYFTFPMGNFTNLNGTLFYTAYLNDTYYIWKSDGTEAGTIPLQEAYHFIDQPLPQFTILNGAIYYFNAVNDYSYSFSLWKMDLKGLNQQPVFGFPMPDFYNPYYPQIERVNNVLFIVSKLWSCGGFKLIKSYGTPTSTFEFFDANMQNAGSNPSAMKNFNGKVYIQTDGEPYYYYYDDCSHPEIWRTNGTANGTEKLLDLSDSKMEIVNDKLFIVGNNYGVELWVADASGAIMNIRNGMSFSGVETSSANGIFFLKNVNGELWRSDGTTAGTYMLRDLYRITSMRNVNGKLMFSAINDARDEELWKSDGTMGGTQKIKTIRRSYALSSAYYPTAVIGNIFYFVANDGAHGNEIWRSDGTEAGTFMRWDANGNDVAENGYEYDIQSFGVFDGKLYYSAKSGYGKWELASLTGNEQPLIVTEMNPVKTMVTGKNELYLFPLQPDQTWEMWVHRNVEGGTFKLAAVDGYLSQGPDFEFINDILYVNAPGGKKLLRSDGTKCGTFPVNTGITAMFPIEKLGTSIVFAGYKDDVGQEPFIYNTTGTPGSPCSTLTAQGTDQPILLKGTEEVMNYSPNPFSTDLHFSINAKEDQILQIKVFKTSGQLVESLDDLHANEEYSMGSSWSQGMFLINVTDPAGKIHSYKVIKK